MLFLLGILTLASVEGQSVTSNHAFKEQDIDVTIHQQSGKIAAKRKDKSMEFIFDYIRELDSAGSVVGGSSNKHSINSFTSEAFTFKRSGMASTHQGISVKNVQFEANITGPGALLVIDVYMFKKKGNVTSENDTMHVGEGTIKINFKIKSWHFCGGIGQYICMKDNSTENGTQLEFGFQIKGSASQPKLAAKKEGTGRKLKTFDLGSANCTLSGEVNKDGSWQEIAGDYPKIVRHGEKTIFVVRFPRFQNEVMYDLTIKLASPGPKSGSMNTRAHSGLIIVCVIGFFFKLFI